MLSHESCLLFANECFTSLHLYEITYKINFHLKVS